MAPREDSSVATILFDVKYAISPINSITVLLIIFILNSLDTLLPALHLLSKNQCSQFSSKPLLLWNLNVLLLAKSFQKFLASMFVCPVVTCQNLHFGKYVRLSVCLSVCLLVCQFCQA